MATGHFDLSNLQFRGRVGDLVYLPQPNGRAIVRRMPEKPPRQSALQAVAAGRVVEVAAAWKDLTLDEGEAWNRWGAAEGLRGYNVFLGLSTKRLQLFPDEPLPRLPPTSAFLGDGIVVVAQASVPAKADLLKGSPEKKGTDGNQGFAGTEAGATEEGEAIGVRFSASGPNAAGVVTELLVQKLKSLHRKPSLKEYKSRGFVGFAPGALEADVPCAPGAYACAIRFVRAETGQETALVPIGKSVVA